MSIYDKLNEPQRQAVFTTEGPVLILAGAGSGKTSAITHRIAHLIDDCGVNAYNILAITFTNKAAREMRERVDSLVGFGSDAAWIMTFHAACVRILRRYIDCLGYGNNFSIYDTDDQKTIIKEVCKRLEVDTKVYKERAVLSQISAAKDELISPDELYQSSGGNYSKMRVAEIYREYQEQLKKNNAVDFDDIINLTVELFEKNREVLEYYQERFRYIMVDEYQDTNTAQFRLIQLLAGKYHNLCVVGDDDQSIYKFRGANIYNILRFEEYFNDVTVIKLEQNYRSTQNILDAANSVIRNNTGRKEKSLWTQAGGGEKISFRLYENGYQEADGIAADISERTADGYGYSDCAVLYRTNAQSRALEERLLEHNIPYRIYGGINFYARREIKDILAYLKTVDNAGDDLSVRRILNVPKRGIGATSMDRIQVYAYEHDISFYEALRGARDIPNIGKAAAKIAPFVALIQEMRSKISELSVRELIAQIVERTGYIEYLEENDTPEAVEERKQNIDELISKAVSYEESTDEPTLAGFLEEVALVADIDNLEEGRDTVSLMTLHSAKGLEFSVVYMAGMEEGLFPSYMSLSSGDISDLEEERRLCYVGITRAKERLVLSAARMRMIRGETQMNRTSRFVEEIPEEYLASSGQAAPDGFAFRGRREDFSLPYRKPGQTAFQSFQKEAVSAGIFDKKNNGPRDGAALDYGVGDRVRHAKFGEGTVTDIKSGGRDYEVTVGFDAAGVRKMFASFAKLSRI